MSRSPSRNLGQCSERMYHAIRENAISHLLLIDEMQDPVWCPSRRREYIQCSQQTTVAGPNRNHKEPNRWLPMIPPRLLVGNKKGSLECISTTAACVRWSIRFLHCATLCRSDTYARILFVLSLRSFWNDLNSRPISVCCGRAFFVVCFIVVVFLEGKFYQNL